MKPAKTNTFDAIAEQLMSELDFSPTDLASMLGVSERSLSTWRKQNEENISPKAFRMKRLGEVLEYIKKMKLDVEQDLSPQLVRAILENSRVLLDGDDEDEQDISLIGYIKAYPKERSWKNCVEVAVKNLVQKREDKGLIA